MHHLCRLPLARSPASVVLKRGYATAHTSIASAPTEIPPSASLSENKPAPAAEDATPSDDSSTHGRRIRRPLVTRRAPISNANPRTWNRPLAEGVLPAYDLALKLICSDSARLTDEAKALRLRVEEQEKKISELGEPQQAASLDAELEKMRDKLHILEVQSQTNLPEVRWAVSNAMVDMNKPVHRHLMEQKWRKDGDLDLLMERIHQMHVVPDALPHLRPSIDLHISTKTTREMMRKTGKVQAIVEPGKFLLPEQTIEPPKLYANVFHTDTRLYTMLLVDPDVPNQASQSYDTFLHWLKPNVPLSATHQSRITDLNSHTRYIPPHPQQGTPYHRYVLLLLPQPPLANVPYSRNTEARAKPGVPTSEFLDIPSIMDAERRQFNVREFARRWGLDGSKGGGVHMWRELWSEDVSRIYAEILKEEEPRYGRPPKADRYVEVKKIKRYI